MYPHGRSLVKKYEDQPFALLGVNSDADLEELKEVIARENITWRSWFDGGSPRGPISTAWNVRSWPTVFVIDGEGVIRFRGLREKALEEAVDGLLAELNVKEGRRR